MAHRFWRWSNRLSLAVLPLLLTGAARDLADQPHTPRAIRSYLLRNAAGMTVRFLDYGATITAIDVPDREGRFANVVLGYGSAAEYREKNLKNRFGATIGRYAGRIASARFVLDGRTYRLQPNDGPNALHGGGGPGFDARWWTVREFKEGGAVGARLTLTSAAGDQGFPGALTVTVTYRLSADNSFRIDYAARTTHATVLNLTNHSYFTMAGTGSGSIALNRLQIAGSRWVATDARGIPNGALPPVAGTPLDFRRAHDVGERIDARHPAMAARGGYNHAWLLDKPRRGALATAAVLVDPRSGRRLTVSTTEPSLQVYTGDYIDGQDVDGSGRTIRPRDGIALETQHLADSPNRPDFPSTVLRPGRLYRSTTIWQFDVAANRRQTGRQELGRT